MNKDTILKLTGTAVATAFASLALASPSSALVTPDPTNTTTVYQQDTTSSISSDGIAWTEVGAGALTALALAGAAVAANGARHRNRAVPQG